MSHREFRCEWNGEKECSMSEAKRAFNPPLTLGSWQDRYNGLSVGALQPHLTGQVLSCERMWQACTLFNKDRTGDKTIIYFPSSLCLLQEVNKLGYSSEYVSSLPVKIVRARKQKNKTKSKEPKTETNPATSHQCACMLSTGHTAITWLRTRKSETLEDKGIIIHIFKTHHCAYSTCYSFK